MLLDLRNALGKNLQSKIVQVCCDDEAVKSWQPISWDVRAVESSVNIF